MNPIVAAVLKTGLLDAQVLAEMERWGVPTGTPPESHVFASPEEVATVLEEALQSEGYVLTKETDLEVLQTYMTTHKEGILHVEDDEGRGEAEFPIHYGKTPFGEYIIGWRSETIADLLVNGLTYIVDDGRKVYLKGVRELYFGDTKAFMICTPRIEALESVTPLALPEGQTNGHGC